MRAYDVIESIDGVPAKSLSLLKVRQIFEEPGRTVAVTLIRDEEPLQATVSLQEYRMKHPILRWEDE